MKSKLAVLAVVIGLFLITGCVGQDEQREEENGRIAVDNGIDDDILSEEDDTGTEIEPDEPERLLQWCVPDTKWDGVIVWGAEGNTKYWEYTGKVMGETYFRETLVCKIQAMRTDGFIFNYYYADENAEKCWIEDQFWERVQSYC